MFVRMLKGVLASCGIALSVMVVIAVASVTMLGAGAPLWSVVAVLGTIGFFVFIFVRARLTNVGFHTIAVGDYRSARLYRHNCKYCTGGAQSLNTVSGVNRWGPIPKADRIVFSGTDHFHSPLANVRRCNYCHGRGFTLLPYPPEEKLDLPAHP